MRSDGCITYYVVQHYQGTPDTSGQWVDTALEYVLFHDLTYDQKRGRVGDRFREVIAKQGASTRLWQGYGVHGFVDAADARDALRVCTAKGGHEFRLVLRTATRVQQVVA